MANDLKVNIRGDGSQLSSELTRAASDVARLERQAKNAQKELGNFNKSVTGTVGGLKNLGNAFKSGNITSFSTGITSLGSNLKGLIPVMGSVGGAGTSMGAMLSAALGPIGLITAAIGAIGAVTVGAVKSVSEFEEHLDNLQSLTGLDDSSMKEVADGAINMSKNFKASASDIVDSMKLIGSQAPQLLSNKEALMQVTESANVLAEAAGIEVVDAAKGLTTVMNQMGVDASKADEIINVLAASSQKGSADVAYLNTAFEKAGTVASNAGLSYQQLAGAIETIAPKFSSADVAGTSLAATFKALEKQSDDSLKPSIVGIEQALDNLAAKNLSTAETIKLFGDTGYIAADALIKQRAEFSNLTDAISGTDTAYSQMKTNTDNMAGAFNSLKSTWEACMLQLGQSDFIQGIISAFKHLMEVIGHLCKTVFDLVQAILNLDAVKVTLGVIYILWENLINAVDLLIEIVEVLVALFNKGVKFMRDLWASFLKRMSNNAVFSWLKKQFQNIVDWVMNLVTKAKELWNKFRTWLGLEPVKGEIKVSTAISGNTNAPTETPDTSEPSTDKVSTKTSSTKKSSNNKQTFETGSIKDYENQLQKLNNELNNKNVSDERLKKILEEKKAIEGQIKALRQRNGLEEKEEPLVEGSANYINKQISDKETKLNNLVIGSDDWKKLQKEIETLKASLKVEPELAEGSLAWINKELSDKQAKLQLEVVGSEKYKQLAEEISKLTGKKNEIELKVKDDTLDEATKKTDELKKAQEKAKEVAQLNQQGYQALSSTFGSLGSAIGGTAGKFLELAGQTVAAIGQIIPQVVALIGAKQAEALASGTASAAALPFPANIAAIASIIATITALFASFAGSFASGGIIGGSTTVGDFNIARVNKGEMILNSREQGKLFNMLSGSGFYSTSSDGGGSVQFKIHGKELVGVLSNYNNKTNRVM